MLVHVESVGLLREIVRSDDSSCFRFFVRVTAAEDPRSDSGYRIAKKENYSLVVIRMYPALHVYLVPAWQLLLRFGAFTLLPLALVELLDIDALPPTPQLAKC